MTYSFRIDAEQCRALGGLPSPLWGGVGGGGHAIDAPVCPSAPPPSPALPHKGGGSTPSLLLAPFPLPKLLLSAWLTGRANDPRAAAWARRSSRSWPCRPRSCRG